MAKLTFIIWVILCILTKLAFPPELIRDASLFIYLHPYFCTLPRYPIILPPLAWCYVFWEEIPIAVKIFFSIGVFLIITVLLSSFDIILILIYYHQKKYYVSPCTFEEEETKGQIMSLLIKINH